MEKIILLSLKVSSILGALIMFGVLASMNIVLLFLIASLSHLF